MKKEKELFYVVDSKNIDKFLGELTKAFKKIPKKVYKNGLVSGLKDLEVKIYKPGKALLNNGRRRKTT